MSLLFTPEEKMRKMRRQFKIRQKKPCYGILVRYKKDKKNRAQKKKAGGLEKSNEIYNPGLLF